MISTDPTYPADAVRFEYRVVGKGWSEARFAVGARELRLTASYLDDALGNLLGAARKLTDGLASATAAWAEEPGEHRWVLHRQGDDVRVRICAFPALGTNRDDEDGELLLDVTCGLPAFRAAIVAGARTVLDEHGEAGYLAAWGHPFPTRHLLALEST